MRRRKALISLFGVIFLTLIINTYQKETENTSDFPEILCDIPTYRNARLAAYMSSFNADPYIAVFLSDDHWENVLRFYRDRLKMDYKVLTYGRGKKVNMTVYQFEIEKGVLKDYIAKGVEIIPLNAGSQRIYQAQTKIKIIIPQKEIQKKRL